MNNRTSYLISQAEKSLNKYESLFKMNPTIFMKGMVKNTKELIEKLKANCSDTPKQLP